MLAELLDVALRSPVPRLGFLAEGWLGNHSRVARSSSIPPAHAWLPELPASRQELASFSGLAEVVDHQDCQVHYGVLLMACYDGALIHSPYLDLVDPKEAPDF